MTMVLFLLLVTPQLSSAQTSTTAPLDLGLNSQVTANIGLVTTDIRIIIARIIRVALGLMGIVLVCVILYGGIIWMTAGGNEEKIASAKKIIFNGVIGLLIVLSSFSIASFIIGKLIDATTGSNNNQAGTVQISSTGSSFFGSGSLGSIIKDHYPSRGQLDVPRNTKIIISFKKAVLASSFINDTNNNAQLGDCVNIGSNMNWETDCDQLKMTSSTIMITRTDTGERIRGASALISYENNKAFTVVIRPYDVLGSDTAFVPYKVYIGGDILLDDSVNNNPSIFAGRSAANNYYEWTFTCDKNLDRLPPHVTSVFPSPSSTEARNSIIQVSFDKSMDPSNLQGALIAGSQYFYLRNNAIYVKTGNTTLPAGNFTLVNNYRTLEFTPSNACGTNACGGIVFCMPVCDAAAATCTVDSYEVLLRAAQTFSNTSFEAVPFSGVMDISGNALDGNGNGKIDPVAASAQPMAGLETGDNYFWKYSLSNDIDITAPTIMQTTPGPDATYINPTDELSILFSKRMRADSLYAIGIEQQPAGEELCRAPRATFNADNTTYVNITHCPFQNDIRYDYYPIVDSNVQDVHFNCFYPGIGPTSLQPNSKASVICDSLNSSNCCNVNSNPFCCIGFSTAADVNQCLNALKGQYPPP